MTGLTRGWHEARGARYDDSSSAPRNYGDPAAEYEAARGSAAVADRSDRRFVRVHGRDPIRMVQGLITNDLTRADEHHAIYAAVLTPKGRMIADVRVMCVGDELLLETDAQALDPLLAHLRKFVPPLFARFEDVSNAWSQLSVYGPRAASIVHDVLDVSPDTANDALRRATLAESTVHVVTTTFAGGTGFDVIVPQQIARTVWDELERAGARPIGHATVDVLRIEAGTPRWGRELGESTIPLEAGLRARAISETKGCYTGQEVIIRILHRGHVNWELRGVLLGDVPAPPPDTPLLDAAGGRKIGRITSSAWSPRQQQAIALAYVRREVAPPAQVRLAAPDGRTVTVVELPFSQS